MCGFSFERLNNNQFCGVDDCVLSHRGPDYYGELILHNCCFRHWRLSIKDVSEGSHQPYKFKNLVMLFNGEIYNYKSLRVLLRNKGYIFETSGDTEIFLKGYDCFGVSFLGMVDGMFSVLIYDTQVDTTFIARDKFGQKPLFYSISHDRFLVASELKVFSHEFGFNDLCKASLNQLLTFGHTLPPLTLLSGVRSLLPGQFLVFDKAYSVLESGNLNERLFSCKKEFSQSITILNVKDALIESVNTMLDTDVKTGVFLSGGMDSGIITCIAKKYLNRSIDCLTYTGNGMSVNDNLGSREIASHFNVNHYIIEDTQYDLNEKFLMFLKSVDSPSYDGFNTYLVSQAAAKLGYKAMLSGVGADELFGGYPSFRYERFYKFLNLNIDPLIDALSCDRKWTYFATGNRFKRYTKLRGFKSLESYGLDFSNYLGSLGFSLSQNSYLDTLLLETYGYMSLVLLRDMDQFSMANSLELRAPFISDNVVALFDHLEFEKSFNLMGPKGVLRSIFEPDFPVNYFNKKKSGFELNTDILMREASYDIKDLKERFEQLGIIDHVDHLINRDKGNEIRKQANWMFLNQIYSFVENHKVNALNN